MSKKGFKSLSYQFNHHSSPKHHKFGGYIAGFTRDVLLSLAAMGSASLAKPFGVTTFRDLEYWYKKWAKLSEKRAANRFHYKLEQAIEKLKQREYIEVTNFENGIRIVLTEAGQKKVNQYSLDKLAIPVPVTWDGRWRFIFFDIPEEYKSGRDVLRSFFKRLGLHSIQKSVWVYPYPCQSELKALTYALGVDRFVWYIESDYVDNEARLVRHFKLIPPHVHKPSV